jgi:hypothetical protein
LISKHLGIRAFSGYCWDCHRTSYYEPSSIFWANYDFI